MSRGLMVLSVLLLVAVPAVAQTGNLVSNPGFESVSNGTATGWKSFGSGYTLDSTAPHSGSFAIQCASQDLTSVFGAYQTVYLNQTEPAPILISGWSKALNVGTPETTQYSLDSYSIYTNIVYTDGTQLYLQHARFNVGTHGWEQSQVVANPLKPVQYVTVFAMFRYHTGTAWFDDLSVVQLSPDSFFDGQLLAPPMVPNGQANGWFVRDVAANSPILPLLSNSGVVGSGAQQLNLQLTNVQGTFSSKTVTATLVDTSGQPRAITLYYVELFDDTNKVWGNDIRNSVPVGTGGEFMNVTSSFGVGATGSMSLYPFGCITGDLNGRALGVPASLGPRITRIVYNAWDKLLYVAFDLALTGGNVVNSDGLGHGRANVGVVRYSVDNVWGFRDAASRYYQLNPNEFSRRATAEGIWLPFADPTTIPNFSDFHFAFHEISGGTSGPTVQDDALGIGSFRYSDPANYWMAMAPSTPRTYNAALAQVQQDAQGTDVTKRQNAQSVFNSGLETASGLYWVAFVHTGFVNGAEWLLNPSPGLPASPSQATKASLTYTSQMADQLYAAGTTGVLDGEYLDGLEGKRDQLDFNPLSLRYALTPPTFISDTYTPVIPHWFSMYELAAFMSNDLHPRGKLLMANGTASQIHAFYPPVDIPGAEVNWFANGYWQPDPDNVFAMRRTLSYRKPYLLLQDTNFTLMDSAHVEKYFQRSLFYGCYPSMFAAVGVGFYWQAPSLYNRDRSLFVQYIPIIQHLSAAGWEPITYAHTDNPVVYVERYGTNYLTVFNDSAATASANISIDLGSFWPAPLPASITITDEITGDIIGTFSGTSTINIHLSLNAEQAAALHLSAVATPTPTPTLTPLPTSTPTRTLTFTWSPTTTRTPSATQTFTASATKTLSPTNSATATRTPTASPSASHTASATATQPPATYTTTATSTLSPSPTVTRSATPTNSPTRTATVTSAPTASPSPSHTPSPSATQPLPSATATPTVTRTPTASPTSSTTATRTISPTGSVSPSGTPTPSASPSRTAPPTATQPPSSATPTSTPTPSPTSTPSAGPPSSPTRTVTTTATSVPTASPSHTASATRTPPPPSTTPTATRTSPTTTTPSVLPTDTATATITATTKASTPTSTATVMPPVTAPETVAPTGSPAPTSSSTPAPTITPSPEPAAAPGDGNCDARVTAADLPVEITRALQGGPATCGTDANGDGRVDQNDTAATIHLIFQP